MFECLCQFAEIGKFNAETFGNIIVSVDGKDVFISEEIQYLYDWWTQTYNCDYINEEKLIWNELQQVSPKHLHIKENESDNFYRIVDIFKDKKSYKQYHILRNELKLLKKI
jgi:hypothetical protein